MTDTIKLIDVAGFRRRNGIKQAELAAVLGVSRGYISVVETSYGKLSEKSIDIILEKWGEDCGLIPYWGRLVQLVDQLVEHDFLDYFFHSDIEPGFLPFTELLTEAVVRSIRYGQIPLSDDIVNKIVTAYPAVNKGWLLTGEGNILYDDTDVRLNAIENTLNGFEGRLNNLETMLGTIGMKVERILQLLEQISHMQ